MVVDTSDDESDEPSPYATEVLSFSPGRPTSFGPQTNARYEEGWNQEIAENGFGSDGSITLGFDRPGAVVGVRVHEVGPAVEDTLVEIRTPAGWTSLGVVAGRVSEKTVSPAQRVFEVRLTDQGSACDGCTQGADIDAVELIR
jgi:hypothetical protein